MQNEQDWVLVPRVPTDEMLIAARNWSHQKYGKPIGNDAANGCWAAMLAAAPAEPAEDVAARKTTLPRLRACGKCGALQPPDAAEAALAEAKAERDAVEKIAHDLTVALTSLTSGGSEYFIRRGSGDNERYYADADFCSRRIRERISGAEDRWRREVERRQAATAERDQIAEAARQACQLLVHGKASAVVRVSDAVAILNAALSLPEPEKEAG